MASYDYTQIFGIIFKADTTEVDEALSNIEKKLNTVNSSSKSVKNTVNVENETNTIDSENSKSLKTSELVEDVNTKLNNNTLVTNNRAETDSDFTDKNTRNDDYSSIDDTSIDSNEHTDNIDNDVARYLKDGNSYNSEFVGPIKPEGSDEADKSNKERKNININMERLGKTFDKFSKVFKYHGMGILESVLGLSLIGFGAFDAEDKAYKYGNQASLVNENVSDMYAVGQLVAREGGSVGEYGSWLDKTGSEAQSWGAGLNSEFGSNMNILFSYANVKGVTQQEMLAKNGVQKYLLPRLAQAAVTLTKEHGSGYAYALLSKYAGVNASEFRVLQKGPGALQTAMASNKKMFTLNQTDIANAQKFYTTFRNFEQIAEKIGIILGNDLTPYITAADDAMIDLSHHTEAMKVVLGAVIGLFALTAVSKFIRIGIALSRAVEDTIKFISVLKDMSIVENIVAIAGSEMWAGLLGPILLVVAAIAGVIAVVYELYEHWGWVKKEVLKLWDVYKEFFNYLFDKIKSISSSLANSDLFKLFGDVKKGWNDIFGSNKKSTLTTASTQTVIANTQASNLNTNVSHSTVNHNLNINLQSNQKHSQKALNEIASKVTQSLPSSIALANSHNYGHAI